MRKEVTQKQKDQWQKTREKGVRKYQENKRLISVVKKDRPVSKQKPKKFYKINKVSNTEKQRQKVYRSLLKEMKKLPDNQICQWPGCTEPSVDCHHGRGRVGKYLLMKKWLKFLCRIHHIYAELHPEEAKEKGISSSRLSK